MEVLEALGRIAVIERKIDSLFRHGPAPEIERRRPLLLSLRIGGTAAIGPSRQFDPVESAWRRCAQR